MIRSLSFGVKPAGMTEEGTLVSQFVKVLPERAAEFKMRFKGGTFDTDAFHKVVKDRTLEFEGFDKYKRMNLGGTLRRKKVQPTPIESRVLDVETPDGKVHKWMGVQWFQVKS